MPHQVRWDFPEKGKTRASPFILRLVVRTKMESSLQTESECGGVEDEYMRVEN